MNNDLPKPNCRNEQFLNAIAKGDTTDLPVPKSRNEKFLDFIARNGGTGEGLTQEQKDKLNSIPGIKTELETKMPKNAILSMSNLGQDIKEAITGGSVAVVGRDSILTENIRDNQVTGEKLNVAYSKHFKSLSYDTTNINYIDIPVLFNNVNGVEIVSNTPFDKAKKYYIVIKYSSNGFFNMAMKVRSRGLKTTSNFTFSGNKSNKSLIYWECDFSNFDRDELNIALAKLSTDYTVTIHSIDMFAKDEIKDVNKLLKTIASYEIRSKNYYYIDTKEDLKILCIGDSLINSGGNMASGIRELTNYNEVYDFGNGGENVPTTIGRFGVFPYYAEPFTLPATTTPVKVVLKSSFNDIAINPVGNTLKNVYIGGVHGDILNVNDARTEFTFTRKKAGEEIVFDRKQTIITDAMKRYNETFFPIISIGTNQGYTTSNPQEYLDIVDAFTRKCSNGKALILGFYIQGNTQISVMQETEKLMKRTYGNMFFNMREYFVNYGLKDCGLTPTEQDLQYMAQGKVPPQLLSDNTHYNDKAKEQLNKRICERLEEIGILKYRTE